MAQASDKAESEQVVGPGEQLRAARESKKITTAEVAAQLRVTKNIIEHLENEQWQSLHGRTYARGYFANYVKFLDLPQDVLLAAFNFHYKAAEISPPQLNSIEVTNNKVRLPAMVLVFLTLFGLAYYFSADEKVVSQQLSLEGSDLQSSDAAVLFKASVIKPIPVSDNHNE